MFVPLTPTWTPTIGCPDSFVTLPDTVFCCAHAGATRTTMPIKTINRRFFMESGSGGEWTPRHRRRCLKNEAAGGCAFATAVTGDRCWHTGRLSQL